VTIGAVLMSLSTVVVAVNAQLLLYDTLAVMSEDLGGHHAAFVLLARRLS